MAGAEPMIGAAQASVGAESLKTCRKSARQVSSSHSVLPGESESLATGWPLQAVIFMTMLSALCGVSLERSVPMP